MIPPVNGYNKARMPLIFLEFPRTKFLKFLKFLKRRQQSCPRLQLLSLLAIQKQRTITGKLAVPYRKLRKAVVGLLKKRRCKRWDVPSISGIFLLSDFPSSYFTSSLTVRKTILRGWLQHAKMKGDDSPSLKKGRAARLSLSFVMPLNHTHLQERDLPLIFHIPPTLLLDSRVL